MSSRFSRRRGEGGEPRVADDGREDPGGASIEPAEAHAANAGADDAQEASEPRQAISSGMQHDDPHEDSGEMLCEVVDLFYGVAMPPENGSSNSGIVSRMVRFLCCARPADEGDAPTKEKDLPRVKPLLEGVGCQVRAGELVAVMGASGAGKSTFLDLVAGRKKDGVCGGEVLLHGEATSSRSSGGTSKSLINASRGMYKRSRPVYITQSDHHVPELTVRESLEFVARLRMGDGYSDDDRAQRVDELLAILGLESCANVRVGSSLVRGISGGQSRRLSVGIGMIDLVNTRLVLMDEPTTGLDSISAMEVVQLARRLTSREEHRAILATVHQPSSEMFALFDKVLVLHKGRQVYYGSAKAAPAVLSRPEDGVVPAPHQNPADFILVAGQSTKLDPLPPREQRTSRRTLGLLVDEDEEESESTGLLALGPSSDGPKYAVGFSSQVSALWWRAGLKQSRNVDEIFAVIGKFAALGIITGIIFWDKGNIHRDDDLINDLTRNVTTTANNCLAAIYFIMLIPVTGHNQAIPDIFHQMQMMSHERVAGAYSTTAAWVTVVTMPIPSLFVGFVILLNISYWCLGFSDYHMKYLRFGGAVFVGNLMGYLISQIVSAACPTPQAAFAAWPMFLIVFFNFAGFTVRLPNVKVWYRWLCDVGFLRWVFQFTVQNQFNDFTEGDALEDLYFGNIRTPMALTGFIAVLYYIGFLFVLLYVMQPRPSRLRVVDETKELVLPGPHEASLTSEGGEVGTGEPTKVIVSRTRGDVGARDDQGPVMVGLGEPEPVEVLSSGPLREMEEGQAAEARIRTELGEASLQVPLLRADKPGRMTMLDAGVREGSRIAFKDLHYHVYTNDKPKAPTEGSTRGIFGFGGERNRSEVHVLRGITGVVERGEIAVILGPSGSGKTTLLDLLAGRKTPSTGRQEGDVIVDGVTRQQGKTTSPSDMAYVTQDNVHYASLTVRQTLDYAAKLRMSSKVEQKDRERRISSMLGMLKLEKVIDTLVGDDTNRGISGGEMKRLSIAVEAIDLPGLLVLDEPTSGLDAPTALEVITAVRSLADLGRTVVVSLHQPSPEIFGLLDICLLMTRGGYTAFFGKANEALDYFASIGLRPPPSSDNDPAGFLLSLVSAAETTEEDVPSALRQSPLGGEALTFGPSMADRFNSEASESIAPASVSAHIEDEHETMFTSTDLDRAFRASATGSAMELSARRAVAEAAGGALRTMAKKPSERSIVWLSAILTHRQFMMRFQDKETLYLNLFQSVFMGIFYGTLYWQLDDGMIYERMSCLFFAALVSLSVYQQSIPLFFQDRLLFYRERGAGVYGALEYWASIGIAPMPLVVVTSILYVGLLYNCVGLNLDTVEHEWYFLLVVFLCNIISLSISQLLAAIARQENIAVDLFPIVLFFLLCHGGFLITLPDLPGILKGWAPDASFVRWAVEGTFVNELRDNEEHVFPVPSGVNATSEEIAAAFLDDYGYGNEVGGIPIRTAVIWILVLNYVVFRALSLAAMHFLVFEKR